MRRPNVKDRSGMVDGLKLNKSSDHPSVDQSVKSMAGCMKPGFGETELSVVLHDSLIGNGVANALPGGNGSDELHRDIADLDTCCRGVDVLYGERVTKATNRTCIDPDQPTRNTLSIKYFACQ